MINSVDVEQVNTHRAFFGLLKLYFLLLCSAGFFALVKTLSLTHLVYEVVSQCEGVYGDAVVIPLFLSDLLYTIFAFVGLYLINGAKNMVCLHISFAILMLLKLISLTTMFLYKDRNWGSCYISRMQGDLSVSLNVLEMVVIVMLYTFCFKMFLKIKEQDQVGKLSLVQILNA